MTIARGAAIGSLIAAIIAVAVLMFGSGGGTEYTVHLQTANQLVKGNEVKVGGLAVGKIKTIKLSDDNQAEVKITINDDFAPLHQGTTATVRVRRRCPRSRTATSRSRPAPTTRPRSPTAARSTADEHDERRRPRPALQHARPEDAQGPPADAPGIRDLVRGQSDNLATRPTSTSGRRCARSPTLLEGARTRPGGVHEPGRERRASRPARSPRAATTSPQLVSNGNSVRAGDRGRERVARPGARRLPRRARQGSVDLQEPAPALVDLNQLTNVSKPSTKTLPPFLASLARLFRTMRPPFVDLREIVDLPGPGQRRGRPDAPAAVARASSRKTSVAEQRQGAQVGPGR